MKDKAQAQLPWCPLMNAPCKANCRWTEHHVVDRTEKGAKIEIYCKAVIFMDVVIAKALQPKSNIVKLFKGG